MTREELHVIIALLREAARVARPTGSRHDVGLNVHGCSGEDLDLAESIGGSRETYRNDGQVWDAVILRGLGFDVAFYGEHRTIGGEA